ncbi:unnamed protein product [Closterium sp. Yama58-4]|nr:unnamed protein product [Closterium sp. Yama58-4]
MSLVDASREDVGAPRLPHIRSAHCTRTEARHARSLSHQVVAPVAQNVAEAADSSQPRSDSESGGSTPPHHPSQLWQRRNWQPAASLQLDPRRQSSPAEKAAFGAARHSRSASAAGLFSADFGGARPDRGASPHGAAVRPAGSARRATPADCATVGTAEGRSVGARQMLARSHSVSGGATSSSKGAVATGAGVAHAGGASQGHREAISRPVRGASASPVRVAAIPAISGGRQPAGGSSESAARGAGACGGTVASGSSAVVGGTGVGTGSIGTHARTFRRSASCAFRAGGESEGDCGERALRRGQSHVVRGSSSGDGGCRIALVRADGGASDAAAASPASNRRAGGAAFQRVFSTSSLEEPFPAGAALSPPRASPTWPPGHARRHSTCANFRALSPTDRALPRKTAGAGSAGSSSSASAAKAGNAPVAPTASVAATSAQVHAAGAPAPAPSAESPPGGGTPPAAFPRGAGVGRAGTRRSASLASLAEWQQTGGAEPRVASPKPAHSFPPRCASFESQDPKAAGPASAVLSASHSPGHRRSNSHAVGGNGNRGSSHGAPSVSPRRRAMLPPPSPTHHHHQQPQHQQQQLPQQPPPQQARQNGVWRPPPIFTRISADDDGGEDDDVPLAEAVPPLVSHSPSSPHVTAQAAEAAAEAAADAGASAPTPSPRSPLAWSSPRLVSPRPPSPSHPLPHSSKAPRLPRLSASPAPPLRPPPPAPAPRTCPAAPPCLPQPCRRFGCLPDLQPRCDARDPGPVSGSCKARWAGRVNRRVGPSQMGRAAA